MQFEIKHVVLYAGNRSHPSQSLDARLSFVLQNVRLTYLLEREEDGWDATQSWEDVLSLGEQQRLGMVSLEMTHVLMFYIQACLLAINTFTNVMIVTV